MLLAVPVARRKLPKVAQQRHRLVVFLRLLGSNQLIDFGPCCLLSLRQFVEIALPRCPNLLLAADALALRSFPLLVLPRVGKLLTSSGFRIRSEAYHAHFKFSRDLVDGICARKYDVGHIRQAFRQRLMLAQPAPGKTHPKWRFGFPLPSNELREL